MHYTEKISSFGDENGNLSDFVDDNDTDDEKVGLDDICDKSEENADNLNDYNFI